MQTDHLGVNKMGKSLRKSPQHQPRFSNNGGRQQLHPQPQVYNISKNDFRRMVQHLTGSPSPQTLPRPPQKPRSMRLKKIRPPPLSPINRPQTPSPVPNDSLRLLSGESPVSAYMRYLQTSMAGPSPGGNSGQPPLQSPIQNQNVARASACNPTNPPFPPQMMNPHLPPPPPPNLPYPTCQFSLPSPSFQLSPLFSPNFSFSPLTNLGVLSPWSHLPPSPDLLPLSCSGSFSPSSPKWRDQ